MGIRNAKIKHIGELIGDLFEERNFTTPIAQVDVCKMWGEVVGEYMATRSTVKCKDGVLFVNSSSSVVSKQLAMNKEGLIEAINQKIGRSIVKKIVVK